MALDVTLESLLGKETRDTLLQKLLDIASGLGLKTETWGSGDPTRTYYTSTAQRFADWENGALNADGTPSTVKGGVADTIRGGFLGLATGDWLTRLLKYNFKVDRIVATYATCTCRLTNTGTANIGTLNPGDVTAYDPVNKQTYRNSTGGVLGPGPATTLDLTFIADVAGSASSAPITEISQLQPPIPLVTVSNTTAAVGTDAELDDAATSRGQTKLDSLSPNGPSGAFKYVILTPALQTDGITNATRVRVVPDSTTGIVTIYIAGAAGALAAADATRATDAVNNWARPIVMSLATGAVQNATNFVQAITYTLWVYSTISKTAAQIQTDVQNYLTTALSTKDIGGDIIPPATSGFLYLEWIRAQILAAVYPYGFRCTIATPAADVALAINQVVTLGAVTPTVNIVVR